MADHLLADELRPWLLDRARVHFLLDGILAKLEALHATGRAQHWLDRNCVGISADDRIELVDSPASGDAMTPVDNMQAFGRILHEAYNLCCPSSQEASTLASDCNGGTVTATQARARLAALGWAGQVTPWPPKFTPSDPQERDLVNGLADDATRHVYADWLEQHGFVERASFVRDELANLATAAPPADVLWRMTVSRALIVGCPSPAGCPARWDALQPGELTRKCDSCANEVHYCITRNEVIQQARARAPCAIDASLGPAVQHEYRSVRWPPPIGNPPPPTFNPPPPQLIIPPQPQLPPDPETSFSSVMPEDRAGVLARFFGWFKKK